MAPSSQTVLSLDVLQRVRIRYTLKNELDNKIQKLSEQSIALQDSVIAILMAETGLDLIHGAYSIDIERGIITPDTSKDAPAAVTPAPEQPAESEPAA